MLLYVVFDKVKRTLSTPLLAPSLEIADSSLKELNPENLSDLIIHPLQTLNNPLDLFLLRTDDSIELPDFIIGAAGNALQTHTSEARES